MRRPPAERFRDLGLTPREADVLAWVGRGKTNAEIATILAASRRTVDKHVERILRKLGVETRTAAARLAFGAECDLPGVLRRSREGPNLPNSNMERWPS